MESSFCRASDISPVGNDPKVSKANEDFAPSSEGHESRSPAAQSSQQNLHQVAPSRLQAFRAAQLHALGFVWVRRRPWVLVPLLVTTVVILQFSAYPLWRIAVLCSLIGFMLLYLVWEAWRVGRRQIVTVSELFVSQTILFLPVVGLVGLTGGLRSPLLPALLSFAVGSMVMFGRGPRSSLFLGGVAGSTVLLALLPAAWFPADLPRGMYATLICMATLYALGAIWIGMCVIGDAYRCAGERLEKTQEDVVVQAIGRARSLETIGSRLAHELKNPLAAIHGLVQLVSRSIVDTKNQERLTVIGSEVERMSDILRDYLSFSRPLEDLSLHPVSLSALIDDVLQVLEARAEHAQLLMQKHGDDISVLADTRRLKEALLNLITNAMEATPPKGSIHVRLVPWERGGRIEICDTGRGIAPDVLPRIGTPFFTTRDGGTGLGVVLARMVIRQHGGDLTYSSQLGLGTTVQVTLPFLAAEAVNIHGSCPFGR